MERVATERLIKDLELRLPMSWRVFGTTEPRLRTKSGSRPDALLTIEGPKRARATILVECKSRIDPVNVDSALNQVRNYGPGVPLIYAPYLSPRTRERIAELGGNYADGEPATRAGSPRCVHRDSRSRSRSEPGA